MAHTPNACSCGWHCHSHYDTSLLGLTTLDGYQRPLGTGLRCVWDIIALRSFLVSNSNPARCHSNMPPLGKTENTCSPATITQSEFSADLGLLFYLLCLYKLKKHIITIEGDLRLGCSLCTL